jgi:hypothetical protein
MGLAFYRVRTSIAWFWCELANWRMAAVIVDNPNRIKHPRTIGTTSDSPLSGTVK